MTLPALVLFFYFHTWPALHGIFLSFTNWNGFGPYHFIGLKNYVDLFHDHQVLHAYGFTFLFAFVTTILVNVLSLAIALALNARIHLSRTFKAIFFMPYVLSTLIVSFIFNYLFSHVIPNVATQLHLTALSQNLLGTGWAWVGIVIVSVWQGAAFNTLLYLAGLQTIPEEVYEASSIDGASSWTTFWRITLPLIAPFLTINLVLAAKNYLQVFDQVVGMTNGGPGTATQSVSFVIYTNGLGGGELSYQSANAVIFLIVLVIVALAQVRLMQGREVQL
ncbi:MAG: sugar ABC transporter permease [Alicyclobacillus herbarius]|uniref:carbohydrate ABC transporter permease n=1 Tax=Alicyclobacillus herbarius TaxID=122960 RepID=UPI0004201238|nr:sugar ABC transporter permease [Alicyclobacillus herbarius]MCL6631399.1 sugar ABC transporter permease [Alicyclobacillus herbarius]